MCCNDSASERLLSRKKQQTLREGFDITRKIASPRRRNRLGDCLEVRSGLLSRSDVDRVCRLQSYARLRFRNSEQLTELMRGGLAQGRGDPANVFIRCL